MNATAAARNADGDRFVVCDVALFYAERSGGIRTYLNEKARFARITGAFEHHLVIPGKHRLHAGGRHELPSLQVAASNGYRLPLGGRPLRETLRAVRPDAFYLPALRRIYQHAYEHVDAVMSTVDPEPDSGRSAAIKLQFGLHPAFRPGPAVPGDHLLFVGRVSLEKRIGDILEAMTIAGSGRPLWIVGDGPARGVLEARARRLGIADLVEMRPFVTERRALARLYREAACVVAPGPHETFGLAVLEAAASGARVVACSSTPAAAVAGQLVRTFTAKDAADLARAIERALATTLDPAAAAALGTSMSWERVFEAELVDLKRLCQ